jgi:hypothetical protein
MPRRHSDFDVLHPSDVNPRGRASFKELRKAYNLTGPQAYALSHTANGVIIGRYDHLCYIPRRSQKSMVRRCDELFVVIQNFRGGLFPSDLGKDVAKALRTAHDREYALEMMGRWLRGEGRDA